MSIIDGGSAAGLVERVREILLRPRPTWETIENEPATIEGLYRGYVGILAATIPVLTFLWSVAISPFFGFGAPLMLLESLLEMAIGYALSLAGVYVFAWIADQLATSFGATRGLLPAFKVGAYGMTAAWGGGLGLVVPVVGVLGLVAGCVYSVWLIHLGLKQLMKPPADKAVPYTAVAVAATAVLIGAANAIVEAVL